MVKLVSCLVCSKERLTYKSGNFCSRECYYKAQRSGLVKPGRAKGWKHTAKAIEKISLAGKKRLGMKFTEEHKSNISKAKKGISLPVKENAGYRALHYWVESRLGKPSTCVHCKRTNLSGKLIQWANISGEYKRDLSDWVRLCAKCHFAFDRKDLKIKLQII